MWAILLVFFSVLLISTFYEVKFVREQGTAATKRSKFTAGVFAVATIVLGAISISKLAVLPIEFWGVLFYFGPVVMVIGSVIVLLIFVFLRRLPRSDS